MPQFGRPEIQFPVPCELLFVEMRRHLVWITRCLLRWVRTRIPSDMTHVARLVTNSVLISRTSFVMDTSFLTSGWPVTCQTRLFWVGQISYVSSATSRKAVPTDWSGSSTGHGLLMSLAGWKMTAAVSFHILCHSSCPKNQSSRLKIFVCRRPMSSVCWHNVVVTASREEFVEMLPL